MLSEPAKMLFEHSQMLSESAQIVSLHSRILSEHAQIVSLYSRMLSEHAQILFEPSWMLSDSAKSALYVAKHKFCESHNEEWNDENTKTSRQIFICRDAAINRFFLL